MTKLTPSMQPAQVVTKNNDGLPAKGHDLWAPPSAN